MTDGPIDRQSWALLKDLWETPVGRRWVLKAGLGSAVALGAELYAGPAVAAAKRAATGAAPADLHFRLGSLPGLSDLVLAANGVTTPLAEHNRTTRTELRRGGGLWRAADASALTHYASGIGLPGDRALLMTVLGRRGNRPVVVAQKWHVPAQVTSSLAKTTYRLSGSMAAVVGSQRSLDELGIDAGDLLRPQHVVELAAVGGMDDAAFGLVSVHPNVATIAPEQHKVTEALITATRELDDLAGHISKMQDDGRDYATFETAVGPDGTPYEITMPASKTGPERVTTFETFKLDEIADGDMGVRRVGNDGNIGAVMGERPDVRSVVGDASGDLYAANDDFLLKLDLEDQRVTRVVGTGTPGYNGNMTVHKTLAPGTAVQVSHPTGLSIARNGDVLFADSGNNLIRAYVPKSGHVINALAGVVTDGSPRGGFNGDGHFARETQFSNPVAVAARSNGEFVVADAGNQRVRKFGPGPG